MTTPTVKVITGDGPSEEAEVMVCGVDPVLTAPLADLREMVNLATILRDCQYFDAYLKVDALIWDYHLRPIARAEAWLPPVSDVPMFVREQHWKRVALLFGVLWGVTLLILIFREGR